MRKTALALMLLAGCGPRPVSTSKLPVPDCGGLKYDECFAVISTLYNAGDEAGAEKALASSTEKSLGIIWPPDNPDLIVIFP